MQTAMTLEFEKFIKIHQGTKTQKLIHNLPKILYAKALRNWSKLTNKTIIKQAQTFWGDPLTVVFPEGMSVLIFKYGFKDEPLTRMVMEYVKPGMTCLDIGSHLGYYSMLFSAIVGEKGTVHSFEPTPSTFEILKINATNTTNTTPHNVAMWSSKDELTLTDYGIELSGYNSLLSARFTDRDESKITANKVTVPTISVDIFTEQHNLIPDFIKIDAESAEYEILKGMKRVITEHKPMIVLEVGDVGGTDTLTSRQLLQHVIDYGYQPMECVKGQIRKHPLQDTYIPGNVLLIPA